MAQILLIQGHPDIRTQHLCHQLMEAYASGAAAKGHQVRSLEVARLDFPLLRSRQDWEDKDPPPSIVQAQESILWADHIMIVFPLWLGDMPAILKGFLEQVLRPGFAMSRDKGGFFKPLLSGRSARIVVTMGMPVFLFRWYFNAHCLGILRKNILRLVGIDRVSTSLIGKTDGLSQIGRERWMDAMHELGAAAK